MTDIKKEALFGGPESRSVTNVVTEYLNPAEKLRRWFGGDTYRQLADHVKYVDNELRTRTKSLNPTLRETLHKARMANKERRYSDTFYYAWEMINMLDELFSQTYTSLQNPEVQVDPSQSLQEYQEQAASEFMGEGEVGEADLQRMHEYYQQQPVTAHAKPPQKLLCLATVPDPEFVSEAGISEWLAENLPSAKSMRGALMEKLFRNQMGKQREVSRAALRAAEQMYSSLESLFSTLDESRTDVNRYIKTITDYSQRLQGLKNNLQQQYNVAFKDTIPKSDTPIKEEVSTAPAATNETDEFETIEVAEPATPEAPAPEPVPTADIDPNKPNEEEEKEKLRQAAEEEAKRRREEEEAEAKAEKEKAKKEKPKGKIPVKRRKKKEEFGDVTILDPKKDDDVITVKDDEIIDDDRGVIVKGDPDDDFDLEALKQGPKKKKRAVEYIISLLKKSQIEFEKGNNGVSAALLLKASEVCDEYDSKLSSNLIKSANRILEDE